jgi:hypothetical protein
MSVQVVYGADGADDEVWVSTYRGSGPSLCQIERINPIDWQTALVNTSGNGLPIEGYPQLNLAWYVDCGLSFTSPGSSTFSGFPVVTWGRPVVAFICPAAGTGAFAIRNLTMGTGLTLGGKVTIPNYVPVSGDVVTIGLQINWSLQPMRLDLDPAMGPNPGLYKSVRKLVLRVLNSIGGQWSCKGVPPVQGTLSTVTDIKAYPITENSGNPPPFTPNVPLDVSIDVAGLFGYSLDPAFAIQGYDPLPFYLLGIAVMSDTGGKA